MDTKTMIRGVKYVAEKHKNDTKFTGQTVITDMCNDIIPKLEKLSAYENAEEEGRLVVLPCKVGDMVYVIAPNHRLCEAKHDCDEYDYENYLPSWCEKYCPYGYKGIGVIKDIVSHIEIRNNGICYCTTNCGYLYDDKVFLAREEAEKALKEVNYPSSTPMD